MREGLWQCLTCTQAEITLSERGTVAEAQSLTCTQAEVALSERGTVAEAQSLTCTQAEVAPSDSGDCGGALLVCTQVPYLYPSKAFLE